ncbi:protein kinase domain-containing protein [Streptomyces sp. NPDC001975]
MRKLADGTDAAVKIARQGQSIDWDTVEHLSTPSFRRHVPRIDEFGEIAVDGTVCGWVAMEYLPTTLEGHLTRERRGGKPREERARTERTVRELTDLLDFWQTLIDRNPLDLKPASILVREDNSGTRSNDGGQFQLVVADFGGAAKFTVSQSYRDFQITTLYMAPEQIVNQNLKATPWWTLGLVLYEVFTGRPLYVLGDDARITDEAWTRAVIVNHEVDLSAVTDARQNLLLQGLLTKDPDDRWTAAEVRRWLRGETPLVFRPAAPDPAPAARRANVPIIFHSIAHHEAESLAAAMAQHSEEAAHWLAAEGGQRLATWLRKELKDTSYDSGQLLELKRRQDRPIRAAVAALAFVAMFAPTATPQYRGRRVDADGIARIAQGQGAFAFIDELLKANVPTVAAGFRCGHAECAGGRCEVLLTLAEELPRTIADVRAQARALGRRPGRNGHNPHNGGDLDQRETNATYALATALLVHPEQREQVLLPLAGLPGPLTTFLAKAPVAMLGVLVQLGALRYRLGALLRSRAADAGFLKRWSELHRRAASGDVRTVSGRAALVSAAVLLPRALRADAIGQDHAVTLTQWWSTAWRPLALRLTAVAALFTVFWLLIRSGAMPRFIHDAGFALVLVPLVCLLLTVPARQLLGRARTAEEKQARLRHERAEQRLARRTGPPLRQQPHPPYRPDPQDAWLLAEPALAASTLASLSPDQTHDLILLTDDQNTEHIPAFQLDPVSGTPYPVVMEINRLLSADEDPWGAADWWLGSNVWLDAAPARLLGTGVDDALLSAARAEIPEW